MSIASEVLKDIYKKRPEWSHKGNFGKLLVVGGSTLYSGSPIFNSMAAYRAGCDLVTVAAPKQAAKVIKSYSPDLIAYILEGDYIGKRHTKTIMQMQKEADAMVIGCGLGRTSQVLSTIRSIIKKTKIPSVIDADAIYAVNFKLKKNFIVTPHSHEFYVLSGKKLNNDVKSRSKSARDLAIKLGCTVLLKGHVDVVTDGNHISLNNTGNSYMTKGGFGDTLAGICGSLLARGVDPYKAACAAAYINGAAGDLAAKKFGESLLASDLLNEIHHVIRK